NIYSEPLLRLLAELPLPKVFLDTVPQVGQQVLGGDLLLLEGRDALRQITGRLLDSGRTRLSFIGAVDYAQTNHDRWLGFVDAYADRGLHCDETLCLTGPFGLCAHYVEIGRVRGDLPRLPVAFVCAGDCVAHFICQYYEARRLPAERQPLLTGFVNHPEYTSVAHTITTVEV